ncbi:MAG: TetR/AcrR family transcriptional regulator [Kofleriaceae bacterium]
MSRSETKEATRIALITAGMEELAEGGLDASLDSICARAGLTRGAFYVHFADRDAFLLAVMQHVLGGFVRLVTAVPAVGGIDRAIEIFFAAVRARAPALHGGGSLRFFHLMDACHRSKPIGDAYRALLLGGRDKLAATVIVDQAEGDARADVTPQALADFMTVAALGIVAMLELEIPLDVTRLAATTRQLFATSSTRGTRARRSRRAAPR